MATRVLLRPLLLAAACALGSAAHAETAYTTRSVHLRTGPARSYPAVAILSAGVRVEVQGCLADYSWCDIFAAGERGWVYAGNLAYPYQGRDVPVLTYGQAIGIGIIGFVILDYWRDHYHDRPWYGDRYRWVHPPPAPRPPGTRPYPPPHPPQRPPRPPEPPHPPPDGHKPPPEPPHDGRRPVPPPRAPVMPAPPPPRQPQK